MNDSMENTSDSNRKFKRKRDLPQDTCPYDDKQLDHILINSDLPLNMESFLASIIFEIGLKNSSPKSLMSLIDPCPNLNTEHIKSHLQKYRIHGDRSKDEFFKYYEDSILEEFRHWESGQSWAVHSHHLSQFSTSNSSSDALNRLNDSSDSDKIRSTLSTSLPSTTQQNIEVAEELLSDCVKLISESANESSTHANKLTSDISNID